MSNNKNAPLDGIEGLKENWKDDLTSGILVSFLALPLCLGIAAGGKFPPITGVFTAIIGGMLVSILSGSKLTIKGPAAGLIAIVLGAFEELGYEKALAVMVVASIIQTIFGLVKAGKLGDFFPISVVHGMLAAIGVIIFSKQIHPLLGVKPTAKSPFALLAEIPNSIANAKWEVALIGLLGLIIIFGMPYIKNKLIKKIPAPMIVLLVAIPLGMVFVLDKKFLVNIPTTIFEGIITLDIKKIGFAFPDFSDITSLTSIKFIAMFALIGSIESLLTVKAIDGLDPFQRKSDMNKDLIAVGLGNTLAAFIGASPMIAEVARSSANVANGAKTRWANFFHGLALLIFILFLAKVIVLIPVSALAAMLIAVAYRLASPKEFIHTYEIGKEQLLIFLTTLIVTLATDILLGVFAGILMKFAVEIFFGISLKQMFKANVEITEEHDNIRLKIKDAAIFSNYLGIKAHLDKMPKNKHLILDFNEVKLIDHTFMENLHHFEHDHYKGGSSVEIQGMEHHNPISDHPLAMRVYDAAYKEKQKTVSLDARQTTLQEFAHISDMGFKPLAIYDSFKFLDFRYFQGKKIRTRENRLIKTIDDTRFEYSEMNIKESISLAGNTYKMGVVAITNIHHHIPSFVLEKEVAMDKISQALGYTDINFDGFKVFSDGYLLTSVEEADVRKLFTPDLITFFEKYVNAGFNVRSRESRIIIFRDTKIMSIDEIKLAMELATGMAEIIKKVVVAK